MKTVGDSIFSTRPHSIRAYQAAYGSLMALLILTFLLAKADLGVWHTPTAFFIASLKAALVMWVFMGVRGGQKLILLLFGGALLLLGIAALLTMADYLTRSP